MIYLWYEPRDYPDKAYGYYHYKEAPDRIPFIRGEQVRPPDRPLACSIEGKLNDLYAYDNVDSQCGFPLAGPRLRKLFDDLCPNDIQYLDTVIYGKDGSTKNYKGVNITNKVPALDHEHTICKYASVGDPPPIIWFGHMALLSNCLGSYDIARMKEDKPTILISERLYQALKRDNITGVAPITVHEYNNLFK